VCNIKRVRHKASLSIPTKGHTDIDIYAAIFTVLKVMGNVKASMIERPEDFSGLSRVCGY
jgi:hypothetical protein